MQTVQGTVRALRDQVIVTDMQFGERVSRGGIVIPDDDALSRGIRPRWAKVYVVGPKQQDIQPDQWILVEHGRWTRTFKLIDTDGVERTIQRVDVDAILAVSDHLPNFDDTINGQAV
jgi:co-chaperonin GroES (HSP10)